MNRLRVIQYAPDAWKLLNGMFCVYKPAGVHCLQVIDSIRVNLVSDLNQLEVRKPKNYAKIEGSLKDGALIVTEVPSYGDNELVIGPRYQPQDIRLHYSTFLGKDTSGVFVMGVNNCYATVMRIREGNLLRVYEIEGKLGIATENFMHYGKVIEKSTFGHIRRASLDKVLGAVQASHQVRMFDYAGVSIQSQAAYEMASKGVVRPAKNSAPLIYGLRCINFEPPSFTLEMQVINEEETYLRELVNEIGLKLKSNAVCMKIRQTRYGHFHLDHALLRKHWTLENIINNIAFCKDASSRYATTPETPFLQQETAQRYIGREESLEDDDDEIDECDRENDSVLHLPEGDKQKY